MRLTLPTWLRKRTRKPVSASSDRNCSASGTSWIARGRVALGWVGLGWVGLGWVGLGGVGGWVGGWG